MEAQGRKPGALALRLDMPNMPDASGRMSGYVSPLATKTSGTYHRILQREVNVKRRHVFPQADGSEQLCDPAGCRECYREAHWSAGQTHGQ